MSFEGRTALVTGGSRGIGREIVRLLLERGAAKVLVVGRDKENLDTLHDELGEAVVPIMCDLADNPSVIAVIGQIRENHPELSMLINNAAVQKLTDFSAVGSSSFWPELENEITTNFTSVIRLTTELLPVLRSQSSSTIVTLTTGLVLAPKKSSPVYCGAKAGLSTFSRSLRYQCADNMPNITVIEALPAIVDTDMTKGRGRSKISAEACAEEIISGMEKGRTRIYVGKTKLLAAIMRIWPSLGYRIMRNG